VKLLMIPYKYLYPSAMFFVCIGVYSTNNDMFQVGEVLVIGIAGYILNMLGFVLGPRFEENFRRALLISRGDLMVFLERPISAVFVGLCVLLIAGQIYVRLRKPKGNGVPLVPPEILLAAQSTHPGTAYAPREVTAQAPQTSVVS
jgi:putative tricarboxylic transport membrane protein